jgi:hypothetical protein
VRRGRGEWLAGRATDAGREGELFFRYIYEAAGCRKPVKRLWVSSLTEGAIRDGFRSLRPGRDYEPLADAARGRSRADWLVGMNLSRLYTPRLRPEQPLTRCPSTARRPYWEDGPGRRAPRGCTAGAPARRTPLLPPVSGPPLPLRTSPPPSTGPLSLLYVAR